MTLEENKAVVRHFWEKAFVANGDPELVDKLVASDHTLRHPGLGEEGEGRDAMKALVSLFLSVSPDFRINVQDEVAEGNKVVVRWTGSGSVREEIAGEAGDEVRVSGIGISRVVRGEITETWLRLAAHPDESWALVPRETTVELLSLNPFILDPMGPRGRIICWIYPPACHPEGPRFPDDLPRPDG
jgi:ketosteroid isomerase-like protein